MGRGNAVLLQTYTHKQNLTIYTNFPAADLSVTTVLSYLKTVKDNLIKHIFTEFCLQSFRPVKLKERQKQKINSAHLD